MTLFFLVKFWHYFLKSYVKLIESIFSLDQKKNVLLIDILLRIYDTKWLSVNIEHLTNGNISTI